MKIRAQIAMVLNLDKCIGCHTCSVTCKNVWTNREGMEYAWFNNVETKPGIGYPKDWENQKHWKGGWTRKKNGKIEPRIGGKWRVLANIFANPDMPEIDDYYEPFTFDYEHLQKAPELEAFPTARPRSLITGERMEKINWGPNWEEILGGEFAKRSKDANFEGVQKEIYGQFENTFMMYLPRLCEHCLNPTCVASCPSGAIYKREEDGIVLIDQDKCRGWRMYVSGCPYKKIYFNWSSGKSEKCIFCYPRIEAGQPTVCSETCVGRIRYLGVMLYDADRIGEAASVASEPDPEPDDLAALDAAWEEEEVLFGPGAASGNCGVDSLAAKLRQARRLAASPLVENARLPCGNACRREASSKAAIAFPPAGERGQQTGEGEAIGQPGEGLRPEACQQEERDGFRAFRKPAEIEDALAGEIRRNQPLALGNHRESEKG